MRIFFKPTSFLLLVLLTLLTFQIYGQRSTRDLNRAGDVYFEKQQYYSATTYYQQSLQINNKDAHANYKLAESHRNLFEYPQAESYYKKVSELYPDRYPLALYYYPLMQKLNGKFDQAISNFDAFIEYGKNSTSQTLAENPIYLEQAYVEKEGAILALNQLSSPFRDFEYKHIGKPLNSEYNDYAPAPMGNDETVVLTSGRSGGKGGALNTRFGESFTDNYRFVLENGKWDELKRKDNFDVNNSKWGDGTGAFTKNGTKFYFTICNENNSEECHLYVSSRAGDKWSEPVELNQNINVPKFDSKQPSLTSGGDTLFFSSDRPGGLGMNDIWMSISSGSDNWGPPVNMGDQVNTVFNEISPYFFEEEKTLFFASDGHRGFGGLDIYMAKGYSFTNPEIYNMGYPFNSNRDDCFFVLGINKGYMASNRKGGLGKFDVYTFNYNTGRAVVAEINTEEAIAGRNSIFSDDFEFDSEDRIMVEKIIAMMVAAEIYGVDLAFTDVELKFYEDLSEEDKKRVRRIVNSRVRNLSRSDISAMREEDSFYYDNLSDDDKEHVDGIITKYLEERGLSATVALNDEDEAFYESLSTREKQKFERLLAYRLKQGVEDLENPAVSVEAAIYESLSPTDKAWVDKAAVAYVMGQSQFENLNLSQSEKDFYNQLEEDYKKSIDASLSFKLRTLAVNDDMAIGELEREYYDSLSDSERSVLSAIASNFYESDIKDFYENLESTEKEFLDGRDAEGRKVQDKILSQLLRNLASSDNYYYESLRGEEKERIERFIDTKQQSADRYRSYINALDNTDKEYYNELSPYQQRRIDRIVKQKAREREIKPQGIVEAETEISEWTEHGASVISSNHALQEELKKLPERLTSEERNEYNKNVKRNFDQIPENVLSFFMEADEETKANVTHLIEAYVTSGGDLQSVEGFEEEKKFFFALDSEKRDKISRIINYPLAQNNEKVGRLSLSKRQEAGKVARDYFISAMGVKVCSPKLEDVAYYNDLPKVGKNTFDRASGSSQYENLTERERAFYNKLSTEEKIRVVNVIGSALETGGILNPSLLSEKDKAFYDKLPPEEQEVIKGISSAPLYNFDVENLLFYQELPEEDKAKLSRIAKSNLKSDIALDYASLSPEDKAFLQNMPVEKREKINRLLTNNLMNLSEEDEEYFEKLDQETKDFINRIRSDHAVARGKIGIGLIGEDDGEIVDEVADVQQPELSETEFEKLASEDVQYYKDLSPEKRRAVNRIVAVKISQEEYRSNEDLFAYDTEYLKTLDKPEKQIVKRLANQFLSDGDPQITEEEMNYYQHMAPEKRRKVNRLVVTEALGADESRNIKLLPEDRNLFNSLDSEEKARIDRISKMRKASARIFGDDLETDLQALTETSVVAQISTFAGGNYDNVTITGKLYNIFSGQPAFGVEIPLLDENDEIVKITSTNKDGSFRYTNLLTGTDYRILSQTARQSITEPPVYFVKDLKVEGISSANVVNAKYDNIYFGFNSADLGDAAKSVLDELVDLTKEYPNMQIEINAYTDQIGSDEYNLVLSERRGRAAFNYLVEKGADRTTIVINPRGKSDPIASNDSEFGRQFNRRVEFNLTGRKLQVDLPYVTYITKPGVTMTKLASSHNMTVNELEEVNNKSTVEGYEPIRLKADIKPNVSLVFERNAANDYILYTVKRGDTVYSLANKYGITQKQLLETNGMTEAGQLKAGQVLSIYKFK